MITRKLRVPDLDLRVTRSRLYRRRILQVNTLVKALAEIYTLHTFAPVSDLKMLIEECHF